MNDVNGKEIVAGKSVVSVIQRARGRYLVSEIQGNYLILDPVTSREPYTLLGAKSRFRVTVKDTGMQVIGNFGGNPSDIIPSRKAISQESEAQMTVDQLAGKYSFILSQGIIEEFRSIECGMSPENLYCDGEATRSQAAATERNLRARWNLLEQYVSLVVHQKVSVKMEI